MFKKSTNDCKTIDTIKSYVYGKYNNNNNNNNNNGLLRDPLGGSPLLKYINYKKSN